MFNLNYIIPTKEENDILNRLDQKYTQYSEIWVYEREFLNALILREKPKKVLEIGIAAGGSSVIMANALKETAGELFSCDISHTYYRNVTKPSGFIMKEYPDLMKRCNQYLGGIACNFMDEIGNGIDFVFIDTAHLFPGELLDFLMIYPYLLPNATVIFHDTSLNLQLGYEEVWHERFVVTGTICSVIVGEKYQPLVDFNKCSNLPCSNITAIKLTPETGQRLWEVFNLLVHTWEYSISENDLTLLVKHFEKWYSKEAVDFFKRINTFQNYNFERRWRSSHPKESEKSQEAIVKEASEISQHIEKNISIQMFLKNCIKGIMPHGLLGIYRKIKSKLKNIACREEVMPISNDNDNYDYDKIVVQFPNDNLSKGKMLIDLANKLKGYAVNTWKNPGSLIVEEKRLFHLLAKHYFTGEGDIFDAGINLGCCVEGFASGFAKNANYYKINKQIWAYELAKFGALRGAGYDWIRDIIKHYYDKPKDYDIDDGDFSYAELVRRNVAHLDGAEKVKLIIGEVMEQEYPDNIEIMFLDLCKTPELNFAMQKLYSRLIPGKSLLIHQDYIYPGTMWIRVTMGYLAEYFDYVGSTPIDSAVWLLKREIPQNVLNVDPYSAFDFHKIVHLHNYWNHVFNDDQKAIIMKTFDLM